MFKQICRIFRFERQINLLRGLKEGPFQPLNNVCFSNRNIGQIGLNIYFLFYFLVYFFIALPQGSVCRFIFSTSYYTALVYNWEVRPVNGLSLWTCWYFILAHILIYLPAKVWHIMNIVPSSTRCTGNLNRKDRIVKVRFLTAMRGTSWQSIIDGPRWKRVLSYHELPVCELKFASCDHIGPIAMEGSSS